MVKEYTPYKMKGWSPFTKASPAKDHETDASGNVKKHELTDEEKLAAANRRREETLQNRMRKYNVSRSEAKRRQTEIEKKQEIA